MNSLAWPPLKDTPGGMPCDDLDVLQIVPLKDTPAGMPCDDSLIGCFANRSIPDVVSVVLFQDKWPSPPRCKRKSLNKRLAKKPRLVIDSEFPDAEQF